MASTVGPPSGPPYLPKTAGVGGHPTVGVDVPILSILLVFYIVGAVSNMTILQLNRRKGHKFLMSGAMFGFCMSRTVTSILRIVWATRPSDASVAITAQIFTNAGVLLLYIVALLLSLRLFCGLHPELGWNKTFDRVLKVMYVLLGCSLILNISFTVLILYTLNQKLRTAALWIQRGAILYTLIFNVVSTALLLLSASLPRSKHWEDFGTGTVRSKFVILAIAIFFLDFIAGFRTGTTWAHPRPVSKPGWYQTKEAFYIIELGFEIVVLYLFTFTRIDKRFWIPDGSKKPGDLACISDADMKTNQDASSSDVSLHTASIGA